MKLVVPITVDLLNLDTSNVPLSETLWAGGTYATGQRAYVAPSYDLYEVVATPSTVTAPVAGSLLPVPGWVKVGKVNRYKMFDYTIGDATVNAASIAVEISPGVLCNALAGFEVVANTVTVNMVDPIEGVVYSRVISMIDNDLVSDWYSYFFGEIEQRSDFVLLDLPTYGSATFEVTLDAGASDARIGELVLGKQVTLGSTAINTKVGIEDFSVKQRDEFGNFKVVQRRFAKTLSAPVLVENSRVSPTIRILTALRATPTVYVGDENKKETFVFGFYKDFFITRTGPDTSEMTIEIEGLV